MQSRQYAHWHQFFEDIPVSPSVFYEALEQNLYARKVPDISLMHVEFPEGGALSPKRLYLEVRRDWLTYHICVAPFGTGFFVSSRLLVWPWRSRPLLVIAAILLYLGLTAAYHLAAVSLGSDGIALLLTLCLSVPALLLFILVVACWYFWCLHMTYYRQDTMLAFHETVHRQLVAEVNQVVQASGRKPLSDAESKPILHKLLERQAA